MNYNIASLQTGLPEDILKKKWAGDINGALEAIKARLKKDLPAMLRTRLELEQAILPRMARAYPLNRK